MSRRLLILCLIIDEKELLKYMLTVFVIESFPFIAISQNKRFIDD